MREFAKSEVIREKCHWCGMKNKLHTELTKINDVVGYSIRCCNCGRVDTFLDPKLYSSVEYYHNGRLSTGRQKCIQESYCPHKQCPLYGTCGGNRKPPEDEKKDQNENKLLNQTELMIKVKPEPKFK